MNRRGTFNNNGILQNIDWLLIIICFSLVVIGIFSLYLVSSSDDTRFFYHLFDLHYKYAKQFLYLLFGIILAITIIVVDIKIFTHLAYSIYYVGCFFVMLTFLKTSTIHGSKSWLSLGGGFNIQPIEFLKIGTILALAKFLSRNETNFSFLKHKVIAFFIFFIPVVLAYLQSELGLGIVYLSLFIVFYREGMPFYILAFGVLGGVLLIATIIVHPLMLTIIISILSILAVLFLRKLIVKRKSILVIIISIWATTICFQKYAIPYFFNSFLKCYQSTRIYNMLGKEYDCSKNKHSIRQQTTIVPRRQDNYNVKQSIIAIGSGGLLGRGIFNATQTTGKFIPEQDTDFIFTFIGETFGMVGTTIVLILFFLLLMRIVIIAERQRSTLSRIYAYSVASMLFSHIFINIGMTIGVFPVVGIPLPFISYGGSSLMSNMIMIAILLHLDIDRQRVVY
ncbi:MAG: rod shape-determining protein RodA [Phycisphaerales bacterium]|nr:rod shape-determining protein RodA [Phycisphaerales bacterium]